MVTLIQWSSLQKSVTKFTPKKFYEIRLGYAESGHVQLQRTILVKTKLS
jgi:hypothetical protein